MTLQDSNDFMTDNVGFGTALRKKGNQDVLNGLREFRDSFQEMMDSIKLPYNQCIDLLLKNVQLDPYFKEFYLWAKANNVPIVVLSGGMEPIIRALLKHLLGEAEANDFQIVSNNVKARPGKSINDEGGWEIVFHDDRYVSKSRQFLPMKTRRATLASVLKLNSLAVASDMTSPWKSENTPSSQHPNARICSTPVTVCRICLLPRRPT